MKSLLVRFIAMVGVVSSACAAEEPVRLYAAGSLKPVMTEMTTAYKRATEVTVSGEFGPSGLLRDRIAKGERADVFASANMEHPLSLEQSGRAGMVRLFARNQLCGLAAPGTGVTPESLLDRMLDPGLKLGTSTPKADPAGDYAWQLFERADKVRPGAYVALTGKALMLTGGPNSAPPPPDRSAYGVLVAQRKADLYLTYCTNAMQARREEPTLEVVAVPDALAVAADYGITVINGAGPQAARFVEFVLSSMGQKILASHGFAAGGAR